MQILRWALLCVWLMGWACCGRAWGQDSGARDVLHRSAEAFRQAGGVEVRFSVRSSEGYSTGTIRLKGEKFVLDAGGMTTWFDGHTQWTYLASADEVNITEPTAEELQGINPYAWLSLYDRGYALRLLQGDGKNYEVEMKATAADAQIVRLVARIDKTTWLPVGVSLTLAGSTEPVVITVRDCRTGLTWPERFFVFDSQAHPTADVIDLR